MRPSRRAMLSAPALAAAWAAVGGPLKALTGDLRAEGLASHEGRLHAVGNVRSLYVPMRDGVRLALDIVLPADVPGGARLPTALSMTRYWRAEAGDGPNALQSLFARHGYATIVGDVRGTGASFGTWRYHRSRDETLDFGDLIAWIVAQPWSDGSVIGVGNSYAGNTADWMAERHPPALKAIVPRFPDYDPYADLYFPGGVPNAYMGRTWGQLVKALDLNEKVSKDGVKSPGVRPVDADRDRHDLNMTLAARATIPSVWDSLQVIEFRDDRPPYWRGASMDDWGIHSHVAAVEAGGTPIQTSAGWMDAGTANGALHRFMTLSNPMRVIIGAWSHGGFHDASPYEPVDADPNPSFADQQAGDIRFMEACRNGAAPKSGDKLLRYFTMGEERWKETREWPLPETLSQTLFLGGNGGLQRAAPGLPERDAYPVDYSATTGKTNRWATNNGAGDVDYGDRAKADERLLCYTGPKLGHDIEITGQPVLHLWMDSTHSDGAFFAYLEEIDPNGIVRYITEGQLRAVHRKVSNEAPPYRVIGPYHTYRRADAMPLRPGEITELSFALMPVSVLVRKGHRLRVAIACADADTFTRIPESGTPIVGIHRGRLHPSRIILPVIDRPHAPTA